MSKYPYSFRNKKPIKIFSLLIQAGFPHFYLPHLVLCLSFHTVPLYTRGVSLFLPHYAVHFVCIRHRKMHEARDFVVLFSALVRATNVHGSLSLSVRVCVCVLFSVPSFHRPRIIMPLCVLFFLRCAAFSTSLNAIKAMTTTDDFVASAVDILVMLRIFSLPTAYNISFLFTPFRCCYILRVCAHSFACTQNFILFPIFMVMHFSFYSAFMCKIAISLLKTSLFLSHNIYIMCIKFEINENRICIRRNEFSTLTSSE